MELLDMIDRGYLLMYLWFVGGMVLYLFKWMEVIYCEFMDYVIFGD